MPTTDTAARERELSRPGGEGNAYVSWTLGQYERSIVRPRRVTWSWSTDGWIPGKYAEHLAALGIEDPTSATASWARGLELLDAAQKIVADDLRDEVGDQLARGELSPGDVHKALARKPTREDAVRRAKDERAAITLGSRRAGAAGCDAVRDFGDNWIPIVREFIERALREGNDRAWNDGHLAAKFLRDASRPRLCGLASLADSARVDAPLLFYMFKRPDLVQRYRIQHAEPGQVREITRYRDPERGMWIAAVTVKAGVPFPSIADFDESWGAGYWTAQEVVRHIAQIRAAKAAELDALATPREPAKRKPAARQAVTA